MSQQNRVAEHEWLAESLAAILDADPEIVAARRARASGRDPSWAGLMGPAGLSFTAADLRVDDIPALITRLFDVAVEEAEWLELAGLEESGPEDDEEEDAPDADLEVDDEVAYALSDDSRPVDDRTLTEAQWSVLVENWWRDAPPFAATSH